MKCEYCGKETLNVIELGREVHLSEIPCCPDCYEMIDKLPQSRKDEMTEYAFITDIHDEV